MRTHCSADPQPAESKHDPIHAAANLVDRDSYGTLILDRQGRIRCCGAPAEKIFGASQIRLKGKSVSEFITGLHLGGSSPSYSTRYLAYLSTGEAWRTFEARSISGERFAVEVKMSRVIADGEDVFLLNLHRPQDATGPHRSCANQGQQQGPQV